MLAVCASIILNSQFSIFNSLRAQDSVVNVRLSDSVAFEMVWVDGGTYSMGNNVTPKGVKISYEAARPEHKVSVDGFFVGRYEVTQGQWKAVMGDNPSRFTGNDSLPVESVSWTEAQQFVVMLSQLTGRHFRLPTEAEWEFAARGGVKAERGNGKTENELPFAGCTRNQLDNYCWYCVNSHGVTHPVGQMQPNELGLYDMSGNVAEWCSDWMAPYGTEEQNNPTGPRQGENRVLRGGHYNSTSPQCTVFDRAWYLPSGKYENYGLRLVMEAGADNEEED